jgi:CRP-like cAMP-binding protein
MQVTKRTLDVDQMQDHVLFRDLPRGEVARIAETGWLTEIDRGTRILSRAEMLDGLYIVFDGRLKIYMLSCNGDERVIRIVEPGESFSEAIMFNGFPSPVFVETLSKSTLGFFPRESISRALSASPGFTDSMLASMSNLMRQLIQDLETCCLQNALQRTVSYLLRMADAAPEPHVEVQLPAPKAVVASTLNMSAETFSRELHRLQDDGSIEINRRVIYLRDRERMVALAEGNDKRPRE